MGSTSVLTGPAAKALEGVAAKTLLDGVVACGKPPPKRSSEGAFCWGAA